MGFSPCKEPCQAKGTRGGDFQSDWFFISSFFLLALYVEGNDVTKFASMAKLKAGRLTREVTDSCLQFWGGMGFTNEVLVSRFYR